MNGYIKEIVFILDRSGSMSGLESDTIGGFNGFIEKQKSLEGKVLITTILFDDKYELLWNGEDINNVFLTDREYYVRASTSLLDAIGKTILDVDNRIKKESSNKKPNKVVFVITTDGMENSSKEFSYKSINKLIQKQEAQYNWDFIFWGANIDTESESKKLGIDPKDTYSYRADKVGISNMFIMTEKLVREKFKE